VVANRYALLADDTWPRTTPSTFAVKGGAIVNLCAILRTNGEFG